MPIDTEHPQYEKFTRRWLRMEHAFEDEETLKDITLRSSGAGLTPAQIQATSRIANGAYSNYITKTAGMRKLEKSGEDKHGEVFSEYVNRARFPAITNQARTGIVGLCFEKDPHGADEDTEITNTGQSNVALARDSVATVSSKGLDVFVVDAPEDGGAPYIATYEPECRTNWRSENEKEPTLTVLKESRLAAGNDKYEHDTETVYREYERLENGSIKVSRFLLSEGGGQVSLATPKILPIKTWPIITPGSIDLKPRLDPIPLLPVARCAFAFFRKSAQYELAVYMSAVTQHWVKGVDEKTYKDILAIGVGPMSLWNLGESEHAEAGILECDGSDIDKMVEGMRWELEQAETYAIRLTQASKAAEAARAIAMRQSTQHASVYTIARSVSLAVTKAQKIRAEWGGMPEPEDFRINTDFGETYTPEQLRILNDMINSFNLPQSVLWEAARRAELTELNDDQIRALLTSDREQSGGLGMLGATAPRVIGKSAGGGSRAGQNDATNPDETAGE